MPCNKSTSLSRTCLCAPATHPGSFRCSLHRGGRGAGGRLAAVSGSAGRAESKGGGASKPDNKARSIRAVLMQMIKPSSHDLCRRRNFQPKPSRFCVMNGGGGQGVAVV